MKLTTTIDQYNAMVMAKDTKSGKTIKVPREALGNLLLDHSRILDANSKANEVLTS